MNVTLIKALALSVPIGALLAFAIVAFARGRTFASFVQLFGAGCLMIVVLTHVCEALQLLPSMRWGDADSAGHYLDLSSAVFGLTLFPIGFVLYRRQRVR